MTSYKQYTVNKQKKRSNKRKFDKFNSENIRTHIYIIMAKHTQNTYSNSINLFQTT